MVRIVHSDPQGRSKGCFFVGDSPSSSLFSSFKRQFLAKIDFKAGAITIQSKTKSKECVFLDCSRISRAFIRPENESAVVFQNTGSGHWREFYIKADCPNNAEFLKTMLNQEMWSEREGAPEPMTPAPTTPSRAARPPSAVTVFKTSPVESSNRRSRDSSLTDRDAEAFVRPLSAPLFTSTPPADDDDVQFDPKLKIRLKINKKQPAKSAVIPSADPFEGHRPMNLATIKADPDGPLSTTNPSSHVDAQGFSWTTSSAARMINFGHLSNDSQLRQSQPVRYTHVERVVKESERSEQLQQQLRELGDLDPNQSMRAPSSAPMNVNTDSSFLNTPDPSPPLLDVQRMVALSLLLQQQSIAMQQNLLGAGMLGGGLGNSPNAGFGSNFGGFGGGGYGGYGSVSGVSGVSHQPSIELGDYIAFESEFEQLAARIAVLNPEKRRLVIEVFKHICNSG